MKKLIPAFSLLLISAVLMSTASYAWFSINTTVSATNMQVTATTSKNLVISNTEAESFAQSISANTPAMSEMLPVSTSDLENWFTTTSAGIAKINYNTGGVMAGNTFAAGDFEVAVNDTKNYYYQDSFKIKVSGTSTDSFAALYVSDINVVGTSALAFSKSLRVGVQIGATFYIYAPKDGTLVYDAITSTAGVAEEVTAYNTYVVAQSLGAVDTTGVTVDVFLWYEGADGNCTSANAISSEELTVDISFSAA